jgi:hypothetical protein
MGDGEASCGAGWYSYDWIDNLGISSAERIVPQLQHLEVGGLIPMSPDGKQGFWIKDFEANRWMLWWDKQGDVTWYWGLYPLDDSQTRLITRVRIRYHWLSPSILFSVPLDVGDIVMMRKCMLGIKQRAEMLAAERQSFAAPGRPDTPEVVVADGQQVEVTANTGAGNTEEKGG